MSGGSLAPYLVHVGYSLMLCALLARDILWLRGLLAVAQSNLSLYALHIGSPSIASWNGLFVLINLAWVIRILQERAAVRLPEELEALYEKHFAALTPPEFLRWWREGERQSLPEGRLVKHGTRPDALYFLLSGEAVVSKDGRGVARVAAGSFIAEMSLLTGEKATADVDAAGAVEFMKWPAAKLADLRRRNPVLWAKIQSVLGHDLVEKIMRASAAPPAAS